LEQCSQFGAQNDAAGLAVKTEIGDQVKGEGIGDGSGHHWLCRTHLFAATGSQQRSQPNPTAWTQPLYREQSPLISCHQPGVPFDNQQQFAWKLLIQAHWLAHFITTQANLCLQPISQGGRQVDQGGMA
jgi:hypothetical protein